MQFFSQFCTRCTVSYVEGDLLKTLATFTEFAIHEARRVEI
jgi:hypothetical protein